MDFGRLSSNEKLAVFGAAATLIGGIVGGTVSVLGWLALLAAIAMLAIVFLPQLSPTTRLPGSQGSLMLICGAVAGIIMVLALLTIIGLLGAYFAALPLNAIFFLIAVVGAVVMAWAGWQAFQAEGGKFQLGSAPTTTTTTTNTTSTTTAAPSSTTEPAATAPPASTAPASPDTTAAPTSTTTTATTSAGDVVMDDDEDRRTTV
ncbi:MAG TPA: hypothetical protein VHK63_06240 [Candidatus Limnocylindria bacterium]|nr:hypothetical protein [Candidatus Limnocylindria bacterium]